MSEYIINGTLLTNIADAVRSVDGSASTLTPTQMETRLKAVKSSIDSALSALTDKKVEVPSGSTVHALAPLIASIEAGGGGVKIASGTIVLSEPSSSVQFVHELGEPVNFFAIFTTESSVTSTTGLFSLLLSRNRTISSRNDEHGSKNVYITVGVNSGNSAKTSVIGSYVPGRSYNVWADNNKLVFDGYAEDGMIYRLKDGVEYMWFATTWSEV